MLYLLRWFWWRVTAWCEIVAMLRSFLISVVFVALGRNGQLFSTDKQLLLTISITTICWVAMAYLGPQTDEQTLVAFYLKVKPFGPGWNRIRQAAGISAAEAKEFNRNNNVPLALLGWVTECILIWSALFTVGNFLYGRLGYTFRYWRWRWCARSCWFRRLSVCGREGPSRTCRTVSASTARYSSILLRYAN